MSKSRNGSRTAPKITLSENPEDDFNFYLQFVRALITKLPNAKDRKLAVEWIEKLLKEKNNACRRMEYLLLLLFALQRRRLSGPFLSAPSQTEPLQPFKDNVDIFGMMERMVEHREQTEVPAPSHSEISGDLKEYAVSQEIPNVGVHCYMATSKDPIEKWKNFHLARIPKELPDARKCLKNMLIKEKAERRQVSDKIENRTPGGGTENELNSGQQNLGYQRPSLIPQSQQATPSPVPREPARTSDVMNVPSPGSSGRVQENDENRLDRTYICRYSINLGELEQSRRQYEFPITRGTVHQALIHAQPGDNRWVAINSKHPARPEDSIQLESLDPSETISALNANILNDSAFPETTRHGNALTDSNTSWARPFETSTPVGSNEDIERENAPETSLEILMATQLQNRASSPAEFFPGPGNLTESSAALSSSTSVSVTSRSSNIPRAKPTSRTSQLSQPIRGRIPTQASQPPKSERNITKRGAR